MSIDLRIPTPDVTSQHVATLVWAGAFVIISALIVARAIVFFESFTSTESPLGARVASASYSDVLCSRRHGTSRCRNEALAFTLYSPIIGLLFKTILFAAKIVAAITTAWITKFLTLASALFAVAHQPRGKAIWATPGLLALFSHILSARPIAKTSWSISGRWRLLSKNT